MNTIGFEELLLVHLALFAMGVQSMNYWEARADRAKVRELGVAQETMIIAEQGVWVEMVMLVVQITFLIVGDRALFQPPTPDPSVWGRLAVLILFMGMEVLLLITSIRNRRDRWRVFRPEIEPDDPKAARRRNSD